jgi:phosphate transport system substrate-binding protein
MRFVFSLFIAALYSAPAGAGELPTYRSDAPVSGTIRIAGSPDDERLIQAWETGFRHFNPGAQIVTILHGPDSTMAWLYTGLADFALLERELEVPVEHMAFTWVYQYPETRITVANAGWRTDRLGAAIAVYVNAANPARGLTLAQIDSLYGAERRRGGAPVKTWGDLGLRDAWAERPVHVYGPSLDSSWALSIRHSVLADSYKWNMDYREVPGGPQNVAGEVARDPDGIGYGPLSAATNGVRPVALTTAQGAIVPLTAETVADEIYPLRRDISIVFNRQPDHPLEPELKEFLRYILSRDGQAAVKDDGAYVPLSAAAAERQRAKLD